MILESHLGSLHSLAARRLIEHILQLAFVSNMLFWKALYCY